MRCLSDRGTASACPSPPKHSLEVFGHAYVCLSAWQCCPVQSAFLGLQGGEAAEPLKICRALCVWICLVCARFEPSSCLSTPHPLAHLSGGGFKSSPKISHGAAENKLVRSPPSHFPRESKLRIDWSCSPHPGQPRLWLRGQEIGGASSLKARTWRCVA